MANTFKYDVGMYGGSFDPLHIGHLSVIYKAASECKELFLVLSYSQERDNTFYRTRWQWLHDATSHLDNVRILLLEDHISSKEEYDKESNWYDGSVKVKEMIGKKIDAVYCGSDYAWAGSPYKRFYPEAKLEFIERSLIPISSTEIRKDPFKSWDYLPTFVRRSFVKKVLICGAESTGKSTLASTLAKLYNTSAVTEYGRVVCERCGSEHAMTNDDFEEILYKHKAAIIDGTRVANKVLFIDTDALTTYFYALHSKCLNESSILNDHRILKRMIDNYDLVLFCNTDVPFVQDGIRVEDRGGSRETLSDWFRTVYGFGVDHAIADKKIIDLRGTYSERLATAIDAVNKKIFSK